MQAVCLKVGKLYNAEYVNQLYKQIKRFHPDCELRCITDDSTGLHPDIIPMDVEDRFGSRKWWNKVRLFQPFLFEEPTIYLDLDCFVHGPLNKFFDTFVPGKLNILKTTWFSDGVATKIHQCNVNSSIMVIDKDNCAPLWEECISHIEKMYQSFYGLDPWIYRRHRENIYYFEPGLAYSYKHGCVFPNDIEQNKLRQLPVCIFDDALDRYEILNGLWASTKVMG